MPTESSVERRLASSHGFLAVASDGPIGTVETPLFPPDSDGPDYLIVCTGSLLSRRPVVSTALVDDVDQARRLVFLRASREEIAGLPEHLPLAH
jgi:hypothetical protein